jgi:hypothetical protein
VFICKLFLADGKVHKPKIAKKPGRSHSATGKPVGRPPSLEKCLEAIQADIDAYTEEILSAYPDEVQTYV